MIDGSVVAGHLRVRASSFAALPSDTGLAAVPGDRLHEPAALTQLKQRLGPGWRKRSSVTRTASTFPGRSRHDLQELDVVQVVVVKFVTLVEP